MMNKTVGKHVEQKNEYLSKGRNKIEKGNIMQHKIIVLGDSHTRGMASNLQHQLRQNYVVQGIVKPGAILTEIVNMPITETSNLTKKDVCVIWGGTHDIGKKEIQKGLGALREFMNSHKHTKVIIITAPHRHDLEANSCVNKEVKTFNRKLKKYVKAYKHVHVIDVDTNRGMYTTHGLHLNQKGKEHITIKVVEVIKDILTRKQENFFQLEWKNSQQPHYQQGKSKGRSIQEGKEEDGKFGKEQNIQQRLLQQELLDGRDVQYIVGCMYFFFSKIQTLFYICILGLKVACITY